MNECSKCKIELRNQDIAGMINCLGINKLWCPKCWEV